MSLSSWVVWVARPEPDNQALCQLIRSRGGEAHALPMIQIHPLTVDYKAQWCHIEYDKIIVMSKPAARLGGPFIQKKQVETYAVGPGTADILKDQGIQAIKPNLSSSEGLLMMPQLTTVLNQNILILKGVEGLLKLQNVLIERGAIVNAVALYSRDPVLHLEPLNSWLARQSINCVVATSHQILQLISQQLSADWMKKLWVFVPSGRLKCHAQSLGFNQITEMPGVDAMSVIQTLHNAL